MLDDGTNLPGRHDGMGAFDGPGGTVTLVRNHEVNGTGRAFGAGGDAVRRDGRRRLHTTSRSRRGRGAGRLHRLNGTMMNCSGGQMPWGAWVTCEETVNGPDVGPDFTGAPNTAHQAARLRLRGAGRGQADASRSRRPGGSPTRRSSFDPREGGSTSPRTTSRSRRASTATRRRPTRWSPVGSTTRACSRCSRSRASPTRTSRRTSRKGATYSVEWVDIDDPDPSSPTSRARPRRPPTTRRSSTSATRVGPRARPASPASRAVYDDGVVYFTSTQGGGDAETGNELINGYGNGFGQVWAYDTRSEKLQPALPVAGQGDASTSPTTSP